MKLSHRQLSTIILSAIIPLLGCSDTNSNQKKNDFSSIIKGTDEFRNKIEEKTTEIHESLNPLLLASGKYHGSTNRWPSTQDELLSFIEENQLNYDLSRFSDIVYEIIDMDTLKLSFTVELKEGPLSSNLTIVGTEIENLDGILESTPRILNLHNE